MVAQAQDKTILSPCLLALPMVNTTNDQFEHFKLDDMQPFNSDLLQTQPQLVKFEDGGFLITGKNSGDFPDVLNQDLRAYFEIFKEELGINVDQTEMMERTVGPTGIVHQKYQQHINSIPVYGSEFFIHKEKGEIIGANGRVSTMASVPLIKTLSLEEARNIAMSAFGVTNWVEQEMLFNAEVNFENKEELVALTSKGQIDRLAYHFSVYPTWRERWEMFVDAGSGEVIRKYRSMCAWHNHDHDTGICDVHSNHDENTQYSVEQRKTASAGPESGSGRDLQGVTRQFSVWREGSTYYLIDGSRSMFNASASDMPNNPVGAIWTIDAFNTSPSNQNFRYDHVTSSNNNSWSDPASVSAHYNGGLAYDYFKNVHNRESINGSGGNMVSFVNVTDDNGRSMGNAFWNGQFMFYGNGDNNFTSLAASKDVAGHEMTHGVVQNTANLEYYGESGAINESMADIFGAMIDRDDWLIGEDVVKRSTFPSGALRSLSDPHNGGSQGSPSWQPKHVNEQYTGSQDNGGVHINSGIPNHAFYLYVQNMTQNFSEEEAKKRAERVYYNALRNYLTKSSQFKDLRIAVVSSAAEIYGQGSFEVRTAEDAFAAVGIGSASGGNYQKDLETNPGQQFMLFTNPSESELDIRRVSDNADFVLSNTDLISRPSVTDDGSAIVFVARDKTIHVMIRQQDGTYQESVLQNQPIWRNAVVSKDGTKLAALESQSRNYISVYDFGRREWQDFELYNPTFSQGVSTGDVLYADVMEFDLSGDWIMYDAKNQVRQNSGELYEYWDVGFLNIWENGNWTLPNHRIEKLFSGLREGTSIGNPTFSKNSDYIVAFDFIEEGFFSSDYTVYGANIETGDLGVIWRNQELGWPDYSISDGFVSFNAQDNGGNDIIAIVEMEDDKITADQSTAALYISNGRKGVWFANGQRVLSDVSDQSEDHFGIIYNSLVEEILHISIEELPNDPLLWSINDGRGHEVLSGNMSADQLDISMSDLPSGWYILNLRAGARTSFYKVMKP